MYIKLYSKVKSHLVYIKLYKKNQKSSRVHWIIQENVQFYPKNMGFLPLISIASKN